MEAMILFPEDDRAKVLMTLHYRPHIDGVRVDSGNDTNGYHYIMHKHRYGDVMVFSYYCEGKQIGRFGTKEGDDGWYAYSSYYKPDLYFPTPTWRECADYLTLCHLTHLESDLYDIRYRYDSDKRLTANKVFQAIEANENPKGVVYIKHLITEEVHRWDWSDDSTENKQTFKLTLEQGEHHQPEGDHLKLVHSPDCWCKENEVTSLNNGGYNGPQRAKDI